MASDSLRTAALRYGVVAGPVTVALLAGVAVLVDFPLKLLGVLTLGVPLLVVPAVVGATDAGIETAAGSVLVGAEAGDPSDHQPDRILPVPDPLDVVCWLSGVGVAGAVLLAATF
ncbi:hypothetical protein LPA44_09400 [Halobacterium sp. KA-4]|uniref:hypothetical protein n=1 Tax=Halobacterium sp. KA-4 TaxID=2896367 RepID=UPI001E61B672|nr:hypothetical protein [Halobacterium sp. KA-4]MCD2200113.1 hypothetical protein [Halobacterium sp. KA-4]